MNVKRKTTNMVIIAVLAAILVIMAVTPLGYLYIGPLAITFNMIPVAIGAIIMGPAGGAVLGAVFGLTSFLQAAGIMGASPLGALLFAQNPFYTVIVCIGARVLDGFIIGLVTKGLNKAIKPKLPNYAITGFLSAALNTVFFMTLLVVLYGPFLKANGYWTAGKNVIVFIAGFVGVNALVEAGVATVLTAAIGYALYKARLVNNR